MKQYRLNIDCNNDPLLHQTITQILGVQASLSEDKQAVDYTFWSYVMVENDNNPLNHILDIIVPKMGQLQEIGIPSHNIVLWLTYEYEHQCAMEFSPQDMKQLGEHGITLCIDCIQG